GDGVGDLAAGCRGGRELRSGQAGGGQGEGATGGDERQPATGWIDMAHDWSPLGVCRRSGSPRGRAGGGGRDRWAGVPAGGGPSGTLAGPRDGAALPVS